jgi:hypothetical protein
MNEYGGGESVGSHSSVSRIHTELTDSPMVDAQERNYGEELKAKEMRQRKEERGIQSKAQESEVEIADVLKRLIKLGGIKEEEEAGLLDIARRKNGRQRLALELREKMRVFKDNSVYDITCGGEFGELEPLTFKPAVFEALGRDCLDKEEMEFVMEGFTKGFSTFYEHKRIGRTVKNPPMSVAGRMAVAATVNEDVRKKLLLRLHEENAESSVWKKLYRSPTRAIMKKECGEPKRDESGELLWRRIFNLSAKCRKKNNQVRFWLESVNGGIPKWAKDVKYSCVEEVVKDLIRAEILRVLAKLDIAQAYTQMGMKREEWGLLGFEWEGETYVCVRMPFGLASACRSFEKLATAMEKIMKKVFGIKWVWHYLDDFLVAAIGTEECKLDLDAAVATLELVGMEVNFDKVTKVPLAVEIYLGLEVDCIERVVRIPAKRMRVLKRLLEKWTGKVSCTKKQAEVLLGVLNFAAKAIRGGRAHMRRMYDTLHGQPERDAEEQRMLWEDWKLQQDEADWEEEDVKLFPEAKEGSIIALGVEWHLDLQFWSRLVDEADKMNGVPFEFFAQQASDSFREGFFADADPVLGWGIVFGTRWARGAWEAEEERCEVACKELIAIVKGCEALGELLRGQQWKVSCDNVEVVLSVRRGTIKNPSLMGWIRRLHLFMVQNSCYIWLESIPRASNSVAHLIAKGDLLGARRRVSLDMAPVSERRKGP